MQLWSTFALSATVLALAVYSVTAENPPGKLLFGISPTDSFRPLESRTDGLDPRKLISNLLVRQRTCDPGYGFCSNGAYCCPLTYGCCSGIGERLHQRSYERCLNVGRLYNYV